MQKYKEVFVKVYIPNWSEEIFGIKNVKNVLPQTYFSDLNAKKNVGTAYGEKLQKPNQKQVRIEELMKKKKSDKLQVKWKGFDKSFDSCIYIKI